MGPGLTEGPGDGPRVVVGAGLADGLGEGPGLLVGSPVPTTTAAGSLDETSWPLVTPVPTTKASMGPSGASEPSLGVPGITSTVPGHNSSEPTVRAIGNSRPPIGAGSLKVTSVKHSSLSSGIVTT